MCQSVPVTSLTKTTAEFAGFLEGNHNDNLTFFKHQHMSNHFVISHPNNTVVYGFLTQTKKAYTVRREGAI